MILRIRSIFDESGTTSGFLTDTNIKKYIDSAQNQIIDRLLALQKKMQMLHPFFEYDSLKILITLKTFNITNATDTYSFTSIAISDYKENYDLQVNVAGTGKYGATYTDIAKLKWIAQNTYEAPNAAHPVYAIDRSNGIIIAPVPTADTASGADFRYYKLPADISAGGDITLLTETHEAMMYLALSMAYDQDKEGNYAAKYLNLFEKHLATIL